MFEETNSFVNISSPSDQKKIKKLLDGKYPVLVHFRWALQSGQNRYTYYNYGTVSYQNWYADQTLSDKNSAAYALVLGFTMNAGSYVYLMIDGSRYLMWRGVFSQMPK